MKNESAVSKTLELAGGTLLPFSSMPGERVRILHGRVWLTEEGNVHDAFLASGEEVSLHSRGLAVVEALDPARIQWIAPVRTEWSFIERARELFRKRRPPVECRVS